MQFSPVSSHFHPVLQHPQSNFTITDRFQINQAKWQNRIVYSIMFLDGRREDKIFWTKQCQVFHSFNLRLSKRCLRLYKIVVWYFFDHSSYYRLISFTNFNAQFLYSLTICMLHYNPRHASSINMPIFRRTNCIITASGIVTLCKRLYREWRYQILW